MKDFVVTICDNMSHIPPYLKLKCHGQSNGQLIKSVLENLNVIDHVNKKDENGKDTFIIYPAECYDLKEIKTNIEEVLRKI